MACNDQHGSSKDVKTPCGKCKPDPKDDCADKSLEKCQSLFRDAVQRYEGRQQELTERERLLHGKINVMERSIPALMAVSMWQASEGQDEPARALDRVRELMRKLSPLPDPADVLLAELTARVKQLDRETAELQDKIIKADVELEEQCMELESLELANRELDEQINCMESKLGANLETVSSDDRICLSKIRRLGEQEVRLKRNIRELEERETALRCQIEAVLDSKRTHETKKPCDAMRGKKHHVHKSKTRKTKDCSNLETELDYLFERDKICGVPHCDALNNIAEQEHSTTCKCQKKLKPNRKKTRSCERLASKCCCCYQKCRDKSCKDPQKKNHRKIVESSDSPWCTPEITNHKSCASLTNESRPKDKPCNVKCTCEEVHADKPDVPCAENLVKAFDGQKQPSCFDDKIESSGHVQKAFQPRECFEKSVDKENFKLEGNIQEVFENPWIAPESEISPIKGDTSMLEVQVERMTFSYEAQAVSAQKSKCD